MSYDKLVPDLTSFESQLLIDPRAPALRELARQDRDGEIKLARAMRFERELDSALDVAVPSGLLERLQGIAQPAIPADAPTVLPAPRTRRFWLAGLAASVAAGGLWLSIKPGKADLVAHCAEHLLHEPYALTRTAAVPMEIIQRQFAEFGMEFVGGIDLQYINPCVVDGIHCLHAVLQREGNPTTALIFPGLKKFDVGQSRSGANAVRVTRLADGALVLLAELDRHFDQLEMQLRMAVVRA